MFKIKTRVRYTKRPRQGCSRQSDANCGIGTRGA